MWDKNWCTRTTVWCLQGKNTGTYDEMNQGSCFQSPLQSMVMVIPLKMIRERVCVCVCVWWGRGGAGRGIMLFTLIRCCTDAVLHTGCV